MTRGLIDSPHKVNKSPISKRRSLKPTRKSRLPLSSLGAQRIDPQPRINGATGALSRGTVSKIGVGILAYGTGVSLTVTDAVASNLEQ
jgi:hypothetical protein